MCLQTRSHSFPFFFFNDTATTEIYTLSLHDALPISPSGSPASWPSSANLSAVSGVCEAGFSTTRSEEHTSELQSRLHLVCRLLLEKKKQVPCEEKALQPLVPDREREHAPHVVHAART